MGIQPRQRIYRYLDEGQIRPFAEVEYAARSQLFPANLGDWSDEHRIAYLFTQGLNLPGNLVFGDVPLQREMEFRATAPVPAAKKLAPRRS